MTRTFQTTAWLAAVGTMMIGGAALGAKAKKAAEAKEPPKAIERAPWGEADGKPVELFTLTNKNGLVVKVTNYGAHVIEVHTPDKHGKMADITEGYGTLDEYVNGKTQYQGATVGRNGNRIANAKFELGGKTYKLAANNGPHNLHGGVKGWNKAVWDAEPSETPDGPSVKFSLVSKDGDEGYPGTVHATTTYTLTNDNELKVEMTATTDKPTVVNMVHHTYWNLHGGTKGDIKDHILQIFADKYTPGLPPEGEVKDVAGTPFDFTKPKAIGKDLKAAGSPGMDAPIGYDENWIVNGDPKTLRPVAKVKDPKSGRVMEVSANQPGVQFYAGIFMDGSTKGKGRTHAQYSGFCLEAQAFPNAINVPAWRDQVILKPGQKYDHIIVHKFSVEKK